MGLEDPNNMPRGGVLVTRSLWLSSPNYNTSEKGQRSTFSITWGHFQPGQVIQWQNSQTGCVQSDCPLFLQRQGSGPRDTWLDSWACSLQAEGLSGCWHLENPGAGGRECGTCNSHGILVGQLCSFVCPFSREFSPNFLLPFTSEPLSLSPHPSLQSKGLTYPSFEQSVTTAFMTKAMLALESWVKFPTVKIAGFRNRQWWKSRSCTQSCVTWCKSITWHKALGFEVKPGMWLNMPPSENRDCISGLNHGDFRNYHLPGKIKSLSCLVPLIFKLSHYVISSVPKEICPCPLSLTGIQLHSQSPNPICFLSLISLITIFFSPSFLSHPVV